MKGANRAKAEKKKKRASERKQRISTRNNGYTKGRSFIPPWPARDRRPTTMLIRTTEETNP